MVRIIPSRLKSYTGGNSNGHSNSNSNASSSGNTIPKSNMQKREVSPGSAATKVNGLMLRIVVLRVRLQSSEAELALY